MSQPYADFESHSSFLPIERWLAVDDIAAGDIVWRVGLCKVSATPPSQTPLGVPYLLDYRGVSGVAIENIKARSWGWISRRK